MERPELVLDPDIPFPEPAAYEVEVLRDQNNKYQLSFFKENKKRERRKAEVA